MGKRHIAPVEAGRVRLRMLDASDLPRTLAWRNQDHIRRWFFFSDPLSPEQHAAWFSRYRDRDDDFVFMIEHVCNSSLQSLLTARRGECSTVPPTQSEGFFNKVQTHPPRPIGQVALYNIDWTAGRAEFGRLMIGEAEAAGQGLAREATAAVLDLAFMQLGLREVYLDVLPANARAIKVYEACGFTVTGCTKKVVSMRKQIAA